MNIDFDEIFKKFEKKAKDLSLDKEGLENLLEKVKDKIKSNRELNEIFDETKLFLDMLNDWIHGRYKNLSTSSIVTMIVSLIYLISPIDLIPDFLPGGFLDDIAVIYFASKKISKEMEDYKIWKMEQENIINEDDFIREESIFESHEEDIFEKNEVDKAIEDEEDIEYDDDIFERDDDIFTSR